LREIERKYPGEKCGVCLGDYFSPQLELGIFKYILIYIFPSTICTTIYNTIYTTILNIIIIPL